MSAEDKSLVRLGWSPWFQEAYTPWDNTGCSPGRIVGMQRDIYEVLTEKGALAAKVTGKFRHEARFKGDFPVTGDWVALENSADQTLIKAVLPRKSKFARKVPIRGGRKLKNGIIDGGATEEQVIAANVDTAFIVTGLDQDFEPRRIERYLALTVQSGAAPVIILNKADIPVNLEIYLSKLAEIAKDTPVHAVSAETGLNLEIFSSYLIPGKTLVFLGSSGVGKSTLTNRLLGCQRQKTKLISSATGKGRHTTTSAEMMFHPSGSMIIDTPGLRELQLWCDENAVTSIFAYIAELEAQCRFADCSHTSEPGCAIRTALAKGELDPGRLASCQKQRAELQRLEVKKKQLAVKMGRRR